MHIGLIGGIGPAATVAYYQRLVAAFRDKGRVLELTIVHADIQTLASNAEVDDRGAQAQVYATHLEQLKNAGADFGTITSLGGSFCYAETQALSTLPLVSAIAPIDSGLTRRGVRKIGLLGTRQILRTALYGQLEQCEALVPSDIEAVHQAYVSTALSGVCTDEARDVLFAAGAEMIERGADAVLLAGTHLGLAFDHHEPGYQVVDALDLHVEHLVALATA